MADKNLLSQMLEHLVNDDQAKAEELFHEYVVAASREIYENLIESEISEEDDNEDDEMEEAAQDDDAEDDKVFKAVFLTENFKMIHSTYNVDVSKAGLAHFKNEAGDLEYYIAIEAKDSKFGD